ncbi:UNVERIFIED_CONTAM: hypothetical protein K2H54_013582 [Gekko kuhli]
MGGKLDRLPLRDTGWKRRMGAALPFPQHLRGSAGGRGVIVGPQHQAGGALLLSRDGDDGASVGQEAEAGTVSLMQFILFILEIISETDLLSKHVSLGGKNN